MSCTGHGEGSTFTLYLPLILSGPESQPSVSLAGSSHDLATLHGSHSLNVTPMARETHVADDRDTVADGDSVLLIVEDDPHYARIVLGLARDRGFKGLVALRGSQGLTLARQFRPAAISLDIMLPDMLGWTVLNQLKLDPATRHIPVQIITVSDEDRSHGLAHGAFAYLVKSPTSDGIEAALDRIKNFIQPRVKRLLVVEDNDIEREAIVALLRHEDIEIVAASSGAQAMAELSARRFDCIVLDLRLPDMSGLDLLDLVHAEAGLAETPVVVFTGKDLAPEERSRLRTMAKSIVLKDVQSPERLLDETSLFLHRVVTDLPKEKQAMFERLHGSNEALHGKKVLVVDDDVRNIFALTMLLENQHVEVLTATNGRDAIDLIAGSVDRQPTHRHARLRWPAVATWL